MIYEVRINNFDIFENEVKLSARADLRNKKFSSNVNGIGDFNVLKTIDIYGPNNVGKTCFIRAIDTIKHVLLDTEMPIRSNMFTNNDICELGISFLFEDRLFNYDFKYNSKTKEFIYEKFSESEKYDNGSAEKKEKIWLLKSEDNHQCLDVEAQSLISIVSNSNVLCYLLDVDKFENLKEMKRILTSFANKIDVLYMNNISLEHTIKVLKSTNENKKEVVNFVKNADLYLNDFEYAGESALINIHEDELTDKLPENVLDQLKLVSTYKDKKVPSILFDSIGTRKITALASYIVEAIKNGRILIVDELDSGIHFKLTRAIVAMFNNEVNDNAQFIFTTHDINLMDCKKLFRKEQIWFIHKDDSGVYLYSLADFKAKNGVRDTTDIIEKYKKGILGAMPSPELINTLLDIKGDVDDQ